MTDEHLPTGPDQETITRKILELWPDTDLVTTRGACFFSVDPDKHWPNFATIVSTDEFDQASNLSRPDVFRLNIGVGKANFERLTATISEPDYAALDRFLPHPIYAPQHWVSILNPSLASFEDLVLPLLTEAHDKLAARRARRTSGEAED